MDRRAKSTKENIPLIINIKQLRVTNKSTILRKRWNGVKWGGSNTWEFPSRKYLHFVADMYFEQSPNSYIRLLTINIYYKHYDNLPRCLSEIFRDALNIANAKYLAMYSKRMSNAMQKTYKQILKDTIWYSNLRDTNIYNINQINIKTNTDSSDYSIIKANKLKSGFYRSFDDFQNNYLIPDSLELTLDPLDSCYKLSDTTIKRIQKPYTPYVISNRGRLYIRLFENHYLPLEFHDNKFEFNIPYKLPHMYALLSMENLQAERGALYNGSNNYIADITGALIGHFVAKSMNKSDEKRILKNMVAADYRTCYIDMYNGDFIY